MVVTVEIIVTSEAHSYELKSIVFEVVVQKAEIALAFILIIMEKPKGLVSMLPTQVYFVQQLPFAVQVCTWINQPYNNISRFCMALWLGDELHMPSEK